MIIRSDPAIVEIHPTENHSDYLGVCNWHCPNNSFLNTNPRITAEVYRYQLDEMHTHLQKMWPALVYR